MVIVWDLSKKCSLVQLIGHKSWVKGIAWDPIGKFIASQSEDRSVIIWRTSDWSVETKMEAPFRSIPSSSFFTRLSWSPDGCFLVVGHAWQAGPISVVISRNTWDVYCDFRGHRLPIVCARFNPRIFRKPPKKEPFYL